MATKFDARQSLLRAALGMVGSAANDTLDTIFPKIDAEIAKIFEDRNVLLTDGGIITFTGTQLQFTENLNIVLNSKISGATPQVISLGSSNVSFSATGRMWYAVIDRTAGTAVQTTDATTLPAVTSANQEVFLIAKRVDAGDGTQRIYWRSGMGQNAGQSLRLGASGSGSGSGTGDDLISLLFRASFLDTFDDGPTSSSSAVNATTNFTDPAAYSAAKGLYQLSYDAAKTVAAGTTTTNLNISASAAFTVKIGDIAINNGEAKRITAVASQSSFTTEAFTTAPTLASQVTISQVVYSKDIYGTAFDGVSLATSFGAATFSEIMVDYEDTSTVGDAIFDINTAPVVAYTASPDNSAFTTVQTRPTLITDQVSSVNLPSAGTALYLRFFANKTSGTGSVNVLRYKVGMQKSTQAAGGGVINSAYAFLNSVGTPVNCTLSVVGGKSTITLGFSYAVGVSSGSPYGSLDVFVNGQLMPRFINSTLTPDGYYTETSGKVITLDKDYSALNLSVEVIQRVAIVDSSTINATNISYIQEIEQQGFQPFVNNTSYLRTATSTTGSPAAGTFYSTIANRTPIVDISQDLRGSMGLEPIMVQQIYQMQSEFGSAGELVQGVVNDDRGLIRFIGNWSSVTDSYGQRAFGAATGNAIEVTFYGTGLNLLSYTGDPIAFTAAVDGGSTTAFSFSLSTALGNRGNNTNQITKVASGLTLGVHTVRLVSTNANNWSVYGFQVENASSLTSLSINPGIGYANGNKVALSSSTLSSFNSTFDSGSITTRGGRVVVYIKSDSTIGKAVTATGSQLNTTSADHTNEDIARVYNWREFGCGRTDDFSSLSSSESSRFFTLDDGITTLIGQNTRSDGNQVGMTYGNTNNDFFSITFVGTGLDIETIINDGAAFSGNVQILVDGTSIFNSTRASLFGANRTNKTFKIVSGLPYGTHTVRFLNASTGTKEIIKNFIVYQPKKPAIPTGAVELADYNLMATYAANTTAGAETVAPGILRKIATREHVYSGTWIAPSIAVTSLGGSIMQSQTNGDYIQYTFYGTGFELRTSNTGGGTPASWQFTITDAANPAGTTNLSGAGFTTSSYGAGITSFTASTGTAVINSTSSAGNGLVVSGMALGWHTMRLTRTTGTGFISYEALDIITPVHSHKSAVNYDAQNTLPIGSAALSDNRKFSPIKDVNLQKKNISQAFGVISNPTTTSTTPVPMPDMSVTHYNTTGRIEINYSAEISGSNIDNNVTTYIYIDGVQYGQIKNCHLEEAGGSDVTSESVVAYVSPGFRRVELYWAISANTATGILTRRNMSVKEV